MTVRAFSPFLLFCRVRARVRACAHVRVCVLASESPLHCLYMLMAFLKFRLLDVCGYYPCCTGQSVFPVAVFFFLRLKITLLPIKHSGN